MRSTSHSPRFQLLLTALLALAATLACNLLGGVSSEAPGEVPSGGVLYEDDFSDPGSGWDVSSFSEGETGYEGGQFRIRVNLPDYDVWANPEGKLPADVIIDVDGVNNGGTEDNSFGVMCRYNEDLANPGFYYFIISSDGYYAIGKVMDDQGSFLSSNVMEFSEDINLGDKNNHIRAECRGDTLTLWANGVQLARVTDGDLASGGVGLIAGTFGIPGADVLFDDFVVTRP